MKVDGKTTRKILRVECLRRQQGTFTMGSIWIEKEMVVAECTSTNNKKSMTENGPTTRDKVRAL